MDRRLLAEDRIESLWWHRCDLRRVQVSEPELDVARTREGLLDGHLLIQGESDEQRERFGRNEAVGFRIAGKRQGGRCCHGGIVAPGTRSRSRDRPGHEVDRNSHPTTAYSIEIRTPSLPSSMSRIGPVMPASIASRIRSEVASERPGTRSRAARPNDKGTRRLTTGRPVSRTWMRRLVAGPWRRSDARGGIVPVPAGRWPVDPSK